MSTPILLDVDTGIDDALALLYIAGSPEAELVAVTCSAGNASLADVVRNTRSILSLAGRPEVEVAPGREGPLVRPLEVTPETHGPRGLGYAEPPEAAGPASDRFGPQVIVDEARRRPGELTLVTLGPLTNLAVALAAEPALPRLLRRWVMMGGAFRVPGNTTPASEWNVHCDPEAASACLRAWSAAIDEDPGVPRLVAMGLDVTETAVLLPESLDALQAAAGPGSALATVIGDALRFYFEFHEQVDGFYGAHIHDPFVAACAIDPSLIAQTEPASVDVDASGGSEDGRTVAHWSPASPNADVVLEADASAFLGRLVDRVGRLVQTS